MPRETDALAVRTDSGGVPHLLSLEELCLIIHEAEEVPSEFQLPEDWTNTKKHPLQLVHYIAEGLLHEELRNGEWADYELMDTWKFFKFVYLILNPLHLLCIESEGEPRCVVTEKRVYGRYRQYESVFNSIQEERVLRFADDPPVLESDDMYWGLLKGMHSWLWLTGDYDGVIAEIIKGHGSLYDLWVSMRWYDKGSLRKNLQLIASKRSGGIAASLLRQLQKEWPEIKRWKTDATGMEEKDFVEFEDVLMHGFDDLLQEWEHATQALAEPAQSTQEETVKCRYIDLEGLAKTGIYSEAEYTKELRHACEQDARVLCEFLKKGMKIGYLDFHGDKMTQIYRHLKECFPGTMDYSYTNFNIYYNKSI